MVIVKTNFSVLLAPHAEQPFITPFITFLRSTLHTMSFACDSLINKHLQTMSNSQQRNNGAHVLLFPIQTSGHVIPILDLANQLLIRGLNVTVVVTPSSLPLLLDAIQSQSTHPRSASLHSLVLSIPEPLSPSLVAVVRATGELYCPLKEWFQSHPSPPVAIISDFFLGWTQKLASELGIPRLVFWASGVLPSLLLHSMVENILDYINVADKNKLFSFPNIPNSPRYPHWKIAQFTSQFRMGDPDWEFMIESLLNNKKSWGAVFNSFTELEGIYLDAVKKEMGHDRVWAVGPLLPSQDDRSGASQRGGSSAVPPDHVLTWLDDKEVDSVVYICFGSRATLRSRQVGSLATALERSGVHFIWCVKAVECGLIPDGFEDRVAESESGFLIKGWAPQVAILRHPAVGAFLSHCGTNSMLEGIANGVMMLTWPIDADQFVNASLLVDEVGMADRACDGGTEIVPDSAKLGEILAQSVKSDHPKKDKVRRLYDAATKAVQDEGSSSKDLDSLVQKFNELARKSGKQNKKISSHPPV